MKLRRSMRRFTYLRGKPVLIAATLFLAALAGVTWVMPSVALALVTAFLGALIVAYAVYYGATYDWFDKRFGGLV